MGSLITKTRKYEVHPWALSQVPHRALPDPSHHLRRPRLTVIWNVLRRLVNSQSKPTAILAGTILTPPFGWDPLANESFVDNRKVVSGSVPTALEPLVREHTPLDRLAGFWLEGMIDPDHFFGLGNLDRFPNVANPEAATPGQAGRISERSQF